MGAHILDTSIQNGEEAQKKVQYALELMRKLCYTCAENKTGRKIMSYNILDFGAVGDGCTNDTAAIQAAINACAAAGGGRVTIPSGRTFRCGLVYLCSNLELHLEMGAVLKGSDHLEDYLPEQARGFVPEASHVPSYENCEYAGAPKYFFLYAKNCENVAITGLGTIHGNDSIYHGEITKWHIEGSFYPRTPMIFMENCRRISVINVTLEHSAFWTVHLVGCQDVLIDGIRIYNDLRMANCDGIDPDHCRNVRISNCHVQCADDCIVFKNTAAAMQYGPCENITVSNCTLISTSAAIKFGSESEALFRNILVENCVISGTNRGISLQLRDPGSIENVIFQNLTISTRLFKPEVYWGAAEPIAITVLRRKEDTNVGTVRNIYFNNVLCEGENGILVYGEREGLIRDIYFNDVQVRLCRVTDHPRGFHDLRPTVGPIRTEKGLSYVHMERAKKICFSRLRCSAENVTVAEPIYTAQCENVTYAD